MFLKLRAFINISDLFQCSQGLKKTSSSYSSKTIWREKSSCNARGASSIGLIIATFFAFLLVLLPMNLVVQELNLYQIINHKVQMATEMVCFDAMLQLDSNALSEENFVVAPHLVNWFEADLKERLERTYDLTIDFEELEVALIVDQLPYKLYVTFEYPYETQFLLKGHLTKKMAVALIYELPLNN